MRTGTRRRGSGVRGFTMIELMVVVIIVGVLAAIATPIYARYGQKARIAEATARMGDILTAAKVYAVQNDTDGDPATASWADSCDDLLLVDCSTPTTYFTYVYNAGTGAQQLMIQAIGDPGGPMAGYVVTMTCDGLDCEGLINVDRN